MVTATATGREATTHSEKLAPPTRDSHGAWLSAIPDTPAGRQHRAIALTSLLTGLRPTQVLKLTPDDIDLRRETWWYKTAAGGIIYWSPLPEPARVAIVLALATRGPRAHGRRLDNLPRDEPIFDVSRQAHSSALRRYARRAATGGESRRRDSGNRLVGSEDLRRAACTEAPGGRSERRVPAKRAQRGKPRHIHSRTAS